MRCVQISASDNRMDCRNMFDGPINQLPRKCVTCGFPNLDHVPQPYFIIKSRTLSSHELALAENGNFFIRDRARLVLDLLAPDLCSYFPTTYQGTTQTTPWLLAVPNHQIATATVNPSITRCLACGQPRSAHPGTQWQEMLFGKPWREQTLAEGWSADSDFEIFKSATWGSSERGWDKWICRFLYLSVRLLHLLKKIKANGFDEATSLVPQKPDKYESEWINQKLEFLKANGVPFHAAGTLSAGDAKWFREFIKTHTRQTAFEYDIKAVEKRVEAKLPRSYLAFAKSVGRMSFDNIDGQQGFTASIRTPDQLGIEGYADEFEDEESKAVNGLTFADTGHGDCFCFDVEKAKKEYSVYLFNHEYNLMEPYAENFAECIKRFASANDGPGL